MNKEEFLNGLRARLAYLPESETEKFIAFYAESIDDRVEDGMSEAEATAAMGDIDSVVHTIESEMPLSTIVRQRVKNSRERSENSGGGHIVWWIVLAVLGSPVWLSLACVLGAAVAAIYIILLALGLSAVFMLMYSVSRLLTVGLASALLALGVALATAGACAALLWPCVTLSKLLVKLPLRFWRWLKGLIIDRRRNFE